ncbi:hypothetical protein A3860_34075 [Niastella vici]|uniref:DUF3667 domain-containing protein n=1 Tax=Niastella vici TaxID=1703345 RepID=A0A1V9FQ07_9BACT|nr:hypothetical protein A3860_34075 [Niastella vici]
MCGQENIEPKETVWSLISHFFYDITHYDGKFFSTTKFLITRPGFLPNEYIEGRRARYLHPIRLYVFSSALFFLCFYSMFHFNHLGSEDEKDILKDTGISIGMPDSITTKALANAKDSHDSAVIKQALGIVPYRYHAKKDSTVKAGSIQKADSVQKTDTAQAANTGKKKKKRRYNFNMTDPDPKYRSIAQYDSAQKALPAGERDNWIERLAMHRQIELNDRYHGDQKTMWNDLFTKFTHTFPYLLFISLPLYAFYLKLLYWRRKQFLYVTHGIFLIYLYIFTFIDLLVYFGLQKIHESMDWDWVGWIEAAVLLYGVYYAYKAMRKFYGQGRGKTILKFFILNCVAFWSIIFLFTAFFLFAMFKF